MFINKSINNKLKRTKANAVLSPDINTSIEIKIIKITKNIFSYNLTCLFLNVKKTNLINWKKTSYITT